MADDKKPKIDLKSRLQKMGTGGPGTTPPPPAAGSIPVPMGSVPPGMPPAMPRSSPSVAPMGAPPPPMPSSSGSITPPPGIPKPAISSRPATLDPSNPLAAVVQPFKPAHAPVAAIAQPQVIEVDEAAIRQARRGAFRGGVVVGLVVGVVFLILGYVGGTATTQGAARTQGVHDAHDLSADLTKAKASLDVLKTKVEEGGKSLVADRKFPSDLAQQLSGMIVDFGGDKLFGRRFSGVPAETTKNLFDFITRVQTLNDRKDLVIALLNKLQKPITDELTRPAGQLPISYVVIVDKDTAASGAFLAPLATPIAPDDKNGVPNELTFLNPRGSSNVKLPRLDGDKIPATGAAVTIVPNTFEKVCPSATRGQIAQLVSSMNSLVDEVAGQKGGGEAITESKPGLSEMAGRLAEDLNKVN
jgi:hypothetical protein